MAVTYTGITCGIWWYNVTVDLQLTPRHGTMTLEQLEAKVNDLERQVAELRREIKPFGALPSIEETFGMFGGDPEFDEIVRLGREYRQQDDAKDE